MRFSQLVFTLIATLLFPLTALAVVGLTSSELQSASEIIIPSGETLTVLEGYSGFSMQELTNISGGIEIDYEARLTSDPWQDDELPLLKLMAYTYSDQDAAETAFDSILDLNTFANGSKSLLDSDERWIFYSSEEKVPDVFGAINNAEFLSYHLLHMNGNVLYQASLYRTDGEFNQVNIQTFATMIEDYETVHLLLEEAVNTLTTGLGILFPPASTELSAKSEKSNLNLSSLYSIAEHGSISFDLYIGDTEGAVGTILDSSGITDPIEGDVYLYLNSDGRLFAGIYAPDFDADCEQQSGWYRIETEKKLNSYEWNEIELHYGIGGFWIDLNDSVVASCSVSQPRSENDLFFGDYPNDTIYESMVGYLENLSFIFSETDDGEVWDEVLSEQLFLDLPNTDSDLEVFQFLKEEGIFNGSDGMLYPDELLNRAEMVKIFLNAFDYSYDEDGTVPFWDVDINAWYAKYLVKAYEIGMIEGYEDGRFLPGHELNRAEFFTMLYRIADPGKISYDGDLIDVSEDDWFMSGAAYALSAGLLNTKSYFGPAVEITRREAANVLYLILK